MKHLSIWLIVILAFAGLLALASARADDARTNRLYARAHLVEVQSSARQDLLTGLMPYVILGVVAIGGTTVAVVALTWPRQTMLPQIIERQTIILIQPGQTRRQAWQQLNETKLLEK